ncbi:MAG: hypothetical protein VX733_00080 [Candidatus Latescibacterota bacterium]|nr:hypothetical protein [Candidatus Latescibacterota bacterium]
MKRAARTVLRKLGTDLTLEEEREQRMEREVAEFGDRHREMQAQEAQSALSHSEEEAGLGGVPDEMLTESEKRHEQYRRRQANDGRLGSTAERLPIMTAEERKTRDKGRPKYSATDFEGPIEKLIEKYRDLEEVQRHLTLGQSMKYEFTEDGQVLNRDGNVIFDGENLINPKT